MKGVLLINLGSPESPNPKDVRTYLDEFLMDERVIDMAYWKRFLLVKGIILNTRPKKSAKAYQKIWWKEGSPLIVLSERYQKKIQERIDLPVALGMRYGSMSIEKGLQELVDKGVTEIYVMPMYPHYAMSSYETVVVKVEEVVAEKFPKLHLDIMPPFYNNPDYIKVLAKSIGEQYSPEKFDHLLFSYHGIPERHIYKTDPTHSHCKIDGVCCQAKNELAHSKCYRHQCLETTKLVAKELGLEKGAYSDSFQSRLLRDPWLKPYTDFELEDFAKKEDKKNMAVVTPAFVADCLETLEEIAMEGKEDFIEAGGKTYEHIPCLNDRDDWVDLSVKWIDNWAKKS
ncbi:MAG: ferrochelatase [Flavobacteriaceae bacterium]